MKVRAPRLRTVCFSAIVPALLAGGCVEVGDDATSQASSELRNDAVRVQAGDNLTVLAVTADDHVVFWDGTSIYVSSLHRNASRTKVADSGAGVPSAGIPMVQISGNVAFIWPDAALFGGGVSRLYVWTAAGGARLASTSSVATTNAAAASPDGRDIVYTTGVSADGASGDIVTARADLRGERSLVTGVDFQCAQQQPFLVGFDRKPQLAAFDGDDGDDGDDQGHCAGNGPDANPVVGYCPVGSSTAQLARWVNGVRHDLASDIRGFPQWSVTHDGSEIFTLVGTPRTNQRPIRIGKDDHVEQIEDIFTGGGSINLDDTIVTFAHPANFEMHRFTGEPPRPTVVADMGLRFSLAFNTVPTLALDYTTGFGSSTGWTMFGNPHDDQTHFDWFLADTLHSTKVPLQQNMICSPNLEPFTADSKHALVYCFDTQWSLTSATLAGEITQISTGDVADFNNFAVANSVITFSDNRTFDADGVGTSDIKTIDLAASAPVANVVAPGAFGHYLPTDDRRRIVYSDHRGLFVKRVR